MCDHIAAGVKAPDKRTRKEHLEWISFLGKTESGNSAMAYWLRYAPRISKKAFMEALG